MARRLALRWRITLAGEAGNIDSHAGFRPLDIVKIARVTGFALRFDFEDWLA